MSPGPPSGFKRDAPPPPLVDQAMTPPPRKHSALGFGGLFLADARADLEAHLAPFLVRVDDDMIAVQDFAIEDLQSERILNQLLDGALQGTSAEVRVVALREQQVFRRLGELQRNLAISEQATHVLETKIDDFDQLIFAQRPEDDDVVDAVQELGLEVRVQLVHDLFRGLLEPCLLSIRRSG